MKISKRKATADKFHHDWLAKRGLDPETLKKRLANVKDPVVKIPVYVYEKGKTSDRVGNGFKTGIIERLRHERPEVQQAILAKAARVEPLFNKGGLQYVTDGTDPKMIGSRSRRG